MADKSARRDVLRARARHFELIDVPFIIRVGIAQNGSVGLRGVYAQRKINGRFN